jgi:threonine dehydrogenase-like Zn-dependent dehydrogenase
VKAVVYNGEDLVYTEVPRPIPDDYEVLIKVKAVGICGTDIAIATGQLQVPFPLILGHEFIGKVVSVGSDVEDDWLHTRVTAEINTQTCGECWFCKNNISSQCPDRKALGIHRNGAMAEFLTIDSSLLYPIPDSVTDLDATFIEPLAAAYQTFEMMPLTPHDSTIAIFGLGKLGFLLLQVAKDLGLQVLVVVGSDKKASLSQQLGADYVINRHAVTNPSYEIINLWGGADIVVDTTGDPNALDQVIASCRSRGKLHIKSTPGVSSNINLTEMVRREITLYTSRCGPFSKAIEGLSSKKINVQSLTSEVFPLKDAKYAFNIHRNNKDHIQTVLTLQ